MNQEKKTPELSRHAAEVFAAKWKDTKEEKQYAESFWNDFFRHLCGVEDAQVAGIEYQKPVKNSISGNINYLDVYWKDVALIEHKSSGESLDKAFLQAKGYWRSLPKGYRPKWIILCNFQFFRLVNVDLNRTYDFPLAELADNIYRFEAIISGNLTRIAENEISVDQVAAKLMANLYLELSSHGFDGHETSIFLNRILFLLFGDDTGMWEKNLFVNLVMQTKEDGSDVGDTLDKLFEVLNTDIANRNSNISNSLKGFPYVNGGIFSEKISIIDFNKSMRIALVNAANYDWSTINPTIFGALFQLVKDKETRRELGEHYTSEENINKIVFPLFLDELQDRLDKAWENKKELKKLRQDLAKIKIFDPACGCGNFLVVSYRHLRQLELELIAQLNFLEGKQDVLQLDGSMGLSITLDQIFGIEIDEWASQVAQMALFLTDHQENLKLEKITGVTRNRFPLNTSAKITLGNALRLNWNDVLTIDPDTYILGNPPFYGARMQTTEQKNDGILVWGEIKGIGDLDYVANWYRKASDYIIQSGAQCAFVSTNSIAQGEQPVIIWSVLEPMGIKINFAHQTFRWDNEASGMAAVHCVIIGFSNSKDSDELQLWEYPDIKREPIRISAKNINAYLLNAPNILISARGKPLQPDTPQMVFGSMPNDGGFLSDISSEEAAIIRKKDPVAAAYLKRIIGGRELIHNLERYCLWLVDASASDLRSSSELHERIAKVKKGRLTSKREATRKLANRPTEFGEIRQPRTRYLAVPLITSENRDYLSVALISPEVISNNKIGIIAKEDYFIFAILSSSVFTVWNKSISGRLESRYNISITTTYNNFPFPELLLKDKFELEKSGKAILELREKYSESSLADLYDPLAMPKDLKAAHLENDNLVLNAFGLNKKALDADILSVLFLKYSQLIESTLL
jgi:hypothetical protein